MVGAVLLLMRGKNLHGDIRDVFDVVAHAGDDDLKVNRQVKWFSDDPCDLALTAADVHRMT